MAFYGVHLRGWWRMVMVMIVMLAMVMMTVEGVPNENKTLIFNASEIVVNPGEELSLECGFQGKFRFCAWENPNGRSIQVQDVHENYEPGMSAPANVEGNECGIIINSTTLEHHGLWTCQVFIRGDTFENSKNVTVTIAPTNPEFEMKSADESLQVTYEAESPIRCSVAAARPAADIHWYLGDEDITEDAETKKEPIDKQGTYKSVSNLTHHFQPSDNGKEIVCSVTHQALLVPGNTSVPLNVTFKPISKSISITPGDDYEVRVNFSANPEPTVLEWQYGESLTNTSDSIPIPGEDGRYTADFEDLGENMYSAILRIEDFNETDANQRYLLVVENEIGEMEYPVDLPKDDDPTGPTDRTSRNFPFSPDTTDHNSTSTSGKPTVPETGGSKTPDSDSTTVGPSESSQQKEPGQDSGGGGSVVVLVIIIILLLVVLGIVIYAYRRRLLCFAPAFSPDQDAVKFSKDENDTENATVTNHHDNTNCPGTPKTPEFQEIPLTEPGVGGEENMALINEDETKDVPDTEKKSKEPTSDGEENKALIKDEDTKSDEDADKKESSPEKEVVHAEPDPADGDSEEKPKVDTDDDDDKADDEKEKETDNKEEKTENEGEEE